MRLWLYKNIKHQTHELVKLTQTIRRQFPPFLVFLIVEYEQVNVNWVTEHSKQVLESKNYYSNISFWSKSGFGLGWTLKLPSQWLYVENFVEGFPRQI